MQINADDITQVKKKAPALILWIVTDRQIYSGFVYLMYLSLTILPSGGHNAAYVNLSSPLCQDYQADTAQILIQTNP